MSNMNYPINSRLGCGVVRFKYFWARSFRFVTTSTRHGSEIPESAKKVA